MPYRKATDQHVPARADGERQASWSVSTMNGAPALLKRSRPGSTSMPAKHGRITGACVAAPGLSRIAENVGWRSPKMSVPLSGLGLFGDGRSVGGDHLLGEQVGYGYGFPAGWAFASEADFAH